MKRVLITGLILLSLCGCSRTKPCTKYIEAFNIETKTTRLAPYEAECPDNSFRWYDVFWLPIFILAAASDTQRAVTSSPHYQAGGSAYKDYTQPQNQPQPQPSYQQQQINNGNGAGQYGNYPIY